MGDLLPHGDALCSNCRVHHSRCKTSFGWLPFGGGGSDENADKDGDDDVDEADAEEYLNGQKENDEGKVWVRVEKKMNLGPDAEVLPLCEDLNPETVGNGDSCWSTCNGQCPNDILQPGLAFDFDEIGIGHP